MEVEIISEIGDKDEVLFNPGENIGEDLECMSKIGDKAGVLFNTGENIGEDFGDIEGTLFNVDTEVVEVTISVRVHLELVSLILLHNFLTSSPICVDL